MHTLDEQVYAAGVTGGPLMALAPDEIDGKALCLAYYFQGDAQRINQLSAWEIGGREMLISDAQRIRAKAVKISLEWEDRGRELTLHGIAERKNTGIVPRKGIAGRISAQVERYFEASPNPGALTPRQHIAAMVIAVIIVGAVCVAFSYLPDQLRALAF